MLLLLLLYCYKICIFFIFKPNPNPNPYSPITKLKNPPKFNLMATISSPPITESRHHTHNYKKEKPTPQSVCERSSIASFSRHRSERTQPRGKRKMEEEEGG